jgi:hypothetical protein
MAGGRGTFPSVISRVASRRQAVSAQPVRSGQIGSLHVSQSSCNREFKKLVDSLRQDSAHLAKGIRCKPTLPSCLADAGCRGLESLDDASEQAAATFESAKSNIKEIAEGAVRYGQRALTEQTGNWQKSFSNKVRAQKQLRKICVRKSWCVGATGRRDCFAP